MSGTLASPAMWLSSKSSARVTSQVMHSPRFIRLSSSGRELVDGFEVGLVDVEGVLDRVGVRGELDPADPGSLECPQLRLVPGPGELFDGVPVLPELRGLSGTPNVDGSDPAVRMDHRHLTVQAVGPRRDQPPEGIAFHRGARIAPHGFHAHANAAGGRADGQVLIPGQ